MFNPEDKHGEVRDPEKPVLLTHAVIYASWFSLPPQKKTQKIQYGFPGVLSSPVPYMVPPHTSKTGPWLGHDMPLHTCALVKPEEIA